MDIPEDQPHELIVFPEDAGVATIGIHYRPGPDGTWKVDHRKLHDRIRAAVAAMGADER